MMSDSFDCGMNKVSKVKSDQRPQKNVTYYVLASYVLVKLPKTSRHFYGNLTIYLTTPLLAYYCWLAHLELK